MKNKYSKAILLTCFGLIGSFLKAQSIDWSVPLTNAENTSTVLITPEGADISTPEGNLVAGDMIGVFYEVEPNVFNCGGKVAWVNADTNITIAARSDDSGAGESTSGFNGGDSYIFYVQKVATDQSYLATVTYNTDAPFITTWGPNDFTNVLSISVDGSVVIGCTDNTALNYNTLATVDDGSCVYPLEITLGVTNPACDGEAGVVSYSITGGTAPFTVTVDELEITDNPVSLAVGSHVFVVSDTGTGDLSQSDQATASISNGDVFTAEVTTDFTQLFATEGDVYLWYLNGTAISGADEQDYTPTQEGDYSVSVTNLDGCTDVSDVFTTIFGCTDPAFLEYNPTANINDGSCDSPIVYGCTDVNYLEYDATANVDDGSCETLIIEGCTDSASANYDPLANVDDGSCIPECPDNTAEVEIMIYSGSDPEDIAWDLSGDLLSVSTSYEVVAAGQMTAINNDYVWKYCIPEGSEMTFNMDGLAPNANYSITVCGEEIFTEIRTATVNFTAECDISVDENELLSFGLTPNPADNIVTLTADLNANESYNIHIYNVVGQEVYNEISKGDNGLLNTQIDVSAYQSGVYFVRVENGSSAFSKRLIIQ